MEEDVFKEILLTPGPTEISVRVLRAISHPAIPHYFDDFYAIYRETTELLKEIYQTRNDVVILPGSGRVGQEVALFNVLEEGDTVICVENGLFGLWFAEMGERAGANVKRIPQEWAKPPDLEPIKEALEEGGKAISVVHSETSTGAINPVEQIGKLAKKHDTLFVVDTVSGLGGMDIRTDEWGVDLCVSASNKALESPIGLTTIAVSDHAWESMSARKSPPYTFAYDLLPWKTRWFDEKIKPGFQVNPSTHLTIGLRESARIILEEGLEQRFNRHNTIAEAFYQGIEAMNLSLLPPKEIASKTVSAVKLPGSIDGTRFRKLVRQNFGILFGGALHPKVGNIIRIGHMGQAATRKRIIPTIAALEKTLRDFGHDLALGRGIEAALKALEKT